MGKFDDGITEELATWMTGQPVFFVASAPLDPEGAVNCSPKGNRKEFAVLHERRVAYLDQTGSGVETIAHLRENGRIVLMFCAFEGPPRIVRLHGQGRIVTPESEGFVEFAPSFGGAEEVGVRCVVVVDVSRVSDSCGYGVPFMAFTEHRPTLDQWTQRKGREGIRDYQRRHNQLSVEGLEGLDVE